MGMLLFCHLHILPEQTIDGKKPIVITTQMIARGLLLVQPAILKVNIP